MLLRVFVQWPGLISSRIGDLQEPVSVQPLRDGQARHVLVTRPEPGAGRTAEVLNEAGYRASILPLSRTVTLDISETSDGFSALVVTSASAFAHVRADFLARLSHLPLFAVGHRTAEFAHEHGFSHVINGGGDAVHLSQTMQRALCAEDRVLYLAGRVRQPVFEALLADAGISMQVRDVYDTQMIMHPVSSLGTDVFAAVMLYSGIAAKVLVEMAGDADLPALGTQTRFLCISQRVADILPERWRLRSVVADQPDENGLFRLLNAL